MFRFWLQFHPLLILPVLLFLFGLSGSIIHWLQCRSPLRDRFVNASLGLPTYVAISTLFALFAAFLLADTMARKDRAAEAVQTEAAALLGLAVGSETVGEGGAAIRAAIRAYAGSVIADEWPRMIDESESGETARKLLELMRAVHDAPARSDISAPLHGHMLALSQKIVDARADRIATVTFHFQSFSWSALFLLGFLTQFILGMGFLDRPASNRSVIVIFSLAAVVALWLIAIQDNPFRGPARISPAAFEAVAAHLPR